MSMAAASAPLRKRPTIARVTRVRRMLLDTLASLEELDSRRSSSIGIPLCRADAALGRWLEELQRKAGP